MTPSSEIRVSNFGRLKSILYGTSGKLESFKLRYHRVFDYLDSVRQLLADGSFALSGEVRIVLYNALLIPHEIFAVLFILVCDEYWMRATIYSSTIREIPVINGYSDQLMLLEANIAAKSII